MKISGTLPEDYNLQQCFFGEHLLGLYPEAVVCIVESEKSALISAAIFPEQVWLATGGIGNLSIEKCQVLKGRNVILHPDLNAFDKWSERAKEIQRTCNCKIKVSTHLEDIATPEAKANGLDVADFMINQLRSNQQETDDDAPQIPDRFSPKLQCMINKNKSLKILAEKLDLQEV